MLRPAERVSGSIALFIAILVVSFAAIKAQLSAPLANDDDHSKSKFRARQPIDIDSVLFGTDATKKSAQGECTHQIDILWSHELSYSIYNTPLLYDLFSDGEKDLVSTTFVRSLEALRAQDGNELPGWPTVFSDSYFHSSPLKIDFDKDGIMDFLIVTANGEIVFVKEDGSPFYGDTLKIPPLEVTKTWYVGLEKDGETVFKKFKRQNAFHEREQMKQEHANDKTESKEETQPEDEDADEEKEGSEHIGSKEYAKKYEKIKSGQLKYDLFESSRKKMGDKLTILMEKDGLGDTKMSSKSDPLYSKHYGKYFKKKQDKDLVYVDAHVLSTPVLCDLDNDGGRDLVVSVSYYFDSEFYSDPLNLIKLPSDIDITKYLAGGLVAFDLDTMGIKFSVHLDLTTTKTSFRSYIYSSPSVADVDQDGHLDVFIGTSLGFIYGLDHKGNLKPGFPLEMAEIQATLTLLDVNVDGHLDIIASDSNGNIVAYNYRGEEIWDSVIQGFCTQPAVVGDVDGDGQVDLVFGSDTGFLWAIRADNGKALPNFPIKTGGKIMSAALLVRLQENKKEPYIVVPSFDGYMYIIDGKTGCFDRIDVGETSFSQVLADDVNNDGKLDLIASTMNGNIFVFSTQMPYHPLNTMVGPIESGNVFAHKQTYQGIYITQNNRYYRDIKGDRMLLEFEIVDKAPRVKGSKRHYEVKILLGDQLLYSENMTRAGFHSREFTIPPTRSISTLQLVMKNKFAQVFTDYTSLSFNIRFYKTFKWILVGPFVLVAIVMLLVKDLRAVPLPM